MTSTPAPSAPLEAHGPDRARALKAKIRERVSDVRRHLIALRVATAEFGEDFDLDEFRAAYDTDEPARLNQVKAVERGLDQLWNYIAELTSFGLELAEVRGRGDELNARRDLAALRRIGVLGASIAYASCAGCSFTSTPPPLPSRSTRPPASSPMSSSRSTTPTAPGSPAASRRLRRTERAGPHGAQHRSEARADVRRLGRLRVRSNASATAGAAARWRGRRQSERTCGAGRA